MKVKAFILGMMIVSAVMLVAASGPVPVVSGQQANPFGGQIGPNLWVAGLNSPTVVTLTDPGYRGKQRMTNWCWAASVQMVLNLDGVAVTQEQVVERIFGGDIDKPGSTQDILTALSGWAFNFGGRKVLIDSQRIFSDQELVDNLSHGWPLIVGMENPDHQSGHAVVITAVTYVPSPTGPICQTIVYRDPWPTNPSRVEVPILQFKQSSRFFISAHVSQPAPVGF
jgi:hypothetical protein